MMWAKDFLLHLVEGDFEFFEANVLSFVAPFGKTHNCHGMTYVGRNLRVR